MINPPRAAPGMLPIPPRTAATNALIPGRFPINGLIDGESMETRIPAAAASAEPSAKVKEITTSLLTPMIEQAVGLSDKARMARPILVFMTTNRRMIRRTMVANDNCQLRGQDRQISESFDHVHRNQLRERSRIRAEPILGHVLQEKRDADRRDQHI